MTILAVYQDDQLQVPVKVLTHTEDITPILAEANVLLQTVEQSLPVRRMMTAAQALELSGELLEANRVEQDMEFAEVLELKGPPGYAETPEGTGQSEQILAGDSLWLFLDGVATVCIHHGDKLLVLGCRCGDLLGLPAGTSHWVVPVTGRQCLIIRSGRDENALLATPTGDDIADRYPVLEL
ncbi:hypothetical protein [Halopseudomonas sp.]|uniref:hypothetical protein n=1 Tax=Halopseudomonas sp. TaxID=2901191 RepID=UPI003566C352